MIDDEPQPRVPFGQDGDPREKLKALRTHVECEPALDKKLESGAHVLAQHPIGVVLAMNEVSDAYDRLVGPGIEQSRGLGG